MGEGNKAGKEKTNVGEKGIRSQRKWSNSSSTMSDEFSWSGLFHFSVLESHK